MPVAALGLLADEKVGTPGIPVAAADLLQSVQHADALQRPEEIHVIVVPRYRLADALTYSIHRVLNLLILNAPFAWRIVTAQSVADGQCQEPDTSHRRTRRLTLLAAGMVAPAAIVVLACPEALGNQG